MLVLSRGIHQQIVIGHEEIIITVVRVRGQRVELGIEAPEEVTVHRKEVYDRIYVQEKGGAMA